jgi:molybdate transport system substrate-binding protein
VQTENAEAGIVALSLVKAPALAKIGRWVEIPLDHFARLEQAAVITAVGEKNALATPYLTFLRSAQARVIFDRYGFLLPPSS